MDTLILVSPKLGISQITGMRNSVVSYIYKCQYSHILICILQNFVIISYFSQPVPIAEIEQLEGVRVQVNDQVSCVVTLYLSSVVHKVSNFDVLYMAYIV